LGQFFATKRHKKLKKAANLFELFVLLVAKKDSLAPRSKLKPAKRLMPKKGGHGVPPLRKSALSFS
jgi:hypothetical protein